MSDTGSVDNPILHDAQKRLSSRKFGLAVFFALASTGLCIADKLTGSQWVESVLWILGLYFTGNLGGHYLSGEKEDKTDAPKPD